MRLKIHWVEFAALRDPGAAISVAGYWALRGRADRAFESLKLGPDRRWASAWLLERAQLQALHAHDRWPEFSQRVQSVVGPRADR